MASLSASLDNMVGKLKSEQKQKAYQAEYKSTGDQDIRHCSGHEPYHTWEIKLECIFPREYFEGHDLYGHPCSAS